MEKTTHKNVFGRLDKQGKLLCLALFVVCLTPFVVSAVRNSLPMPDGAVYSCSHWNHVTYFRVIGNKVSFGYPGIGDGFMYTYRGGKLYDENGKKVGKLKRRHRRANVIISDAILSKFGFDGIYDMKK